MANLSSSRGTVTFSDDLGLDPHSVDQLRRKFRSDLENANPADLKSLDTKFAAWEDLGRMLGLRIAPFLTTGSHVCFLPGRVFTNLPLHCPLTQRSKAHRGVHRQLRPELHHLAGPREPENPRGERGIHSRHGDQCDRPEFRQHALEAGSRLARMLEVRGAVAWLKEEQANHAAIDAALEHSAEVVFCAPRHHGGWGERFRHLPRRRRRPAPKGACRGRIPRSSPLHLDLGRR